MFTRALITRCPLGTRAFSVLWPIERQDSEPDVDVSSENVEGSVIDGGDSHSPFDSPYGSDRPVQVERSRRNVPTPTVRDRAVEDGDHDGLAVIVVDVDRTEMVVVCIRAEKVRHVPVHRVLEEEDGAFDGGPVALWQVVLL